MKNLKIGDRVRCRASFGTMHNPWYKKGEILTVNKIDKNLIGFKEYPNGLFSFKDTLSIHNGVSDFAKLKFKSKTKTYIVSKQYLEAICSVPSTVGDEIEVKVISE